MGGVSAGSTHVATLLLLLLLLLLPLLLCPCRYFGKEAAQIIIKLAAGNGFKKVYVGQDAIMATPAMSAFIRRRSLYGENGLARRGQRDG